LPAEAVAASASLKRSLRVLLMLLQVKISSDAEGFAFPFEDMLY
jgi:hypothetical protein